MPGWSWHKDIPDYLSVLIETGGLTVLPDHSKINEAIQALGWGATGAECDERKIHT